MRRKFARIECAINNRTHKVAVGDIPWLDPPSINFIIIYRIYRVDVLIRNYKMKLSHSLSETTVIVEPAAISTDRYNDSI